MIGGLKTCPLKLGACNDISASFGQNLFQRGGGFHKEAFGGAREVAEMLWTICVILLILWGLGLLTGYTMGGVIHALVVIAIVVVVIQVIQGRRV